MLHIRWKCRFQLKNAAKSMENGQNMLQTVANTVETTMENERFELKTVAHTVEMAVSSSKMLQIAWKMVRTGNQKNFPQTKKNKSPNNLLPIYFFDYPIWSNIQQQGSSWQDFFPDHRENYPSRTQGHLFSPNFGHFQSLGGLSHGKIFSDTGVAAKEKCGVSRSGVGCKGINRCLATGTLSQRCLPPWSQN